MVLHPTKEVINLVAGEGYPAAIEKCFGGNRVVVLSYLVCIASGRNLLLRVPAVM